LAGHFSGVLGGCGLDGVWLVVVMGCDR
jgi:hypothetical protein